MTEPLTWQALSAPQQSTLFRLEPGGTWERRNLPPISPAEMFTLINAGLVNHKGYNGSCEYFALSDKGRNLLESNINAAARLNIQPSESTDHFMTQIVAENGQLADRLAVAERKVEALRKFAQDVANSAPGQPTINDAYAFWVAGQQARGLLMALDELDRAVQS